MKTILRTVAALVAVGLGVLLVPVSPAACGDCENACDSKRSSCDDNCSKNKTVCIVQCGVPLAPGYDDCRKRCDDSASNCQTQCQVEQAACKVKCQIPR
jgi:hypothetical protein